MVFTNYSPVFGYSPPLMAHTLKTDMHDKIHNIDPLGFSYFKKIKNRRKISRRLDNTAKNDWPWFLIFEKKKKNF